MTVRDLEDRVEDLAREIREASFRGDEARIHSLYVAHEKAVSDLRKAKARGVDPSSYPPTREEVVHVEAPKKRVGGWTKWAAENEYWFSYEGKTYRAISFEEAESKRGGRKRCAKCAFRAREDGGISITCFDLPSCDATSRADGKNVYFKEKE